jgi:hypothetical protein
MQTPIFYALSNTSQVAFYDWSSMAINYLKVLTDVTTTHHVNFSTRLGHFHQIFWFCPQCLLCFSLNLAVKRTSTTEIIVEFPEMRCNTLDTAKLMNILMLQVHFILITIQKLLEMLLKIQNLKNLTVLMQIQCVNTKFSGIHSVRLPLGS